MALVIPIGAVRCGIVAGGFFRRDALFRRALRPMIPAGMVVSP
jgi:hypothetical protein